ncbi:Voltage-dependent calcium channel subunit alpha-2/delta-2 [Aphelenchoides besseyi]|nr:Voltage-dependent calcium channel subunit alpha-2/delta-2 [Aphelenchoides besseyi]KAI6194130.1 Voltage-dependent calcium channel subunit alpha-2/delta-2 [Aphelenchoides besseyi]
MNCSISLHVVSLYLLFTLILSASSRESTAREIVEHLESKLRSEFQVHSKIEAAEKGFDKHVRGRLRTSEVEVDDKATDLVVNKLKEFFQQKISSLQRIVAVAEDATSEFDVEAPLADNDFECEAHQQQMNATGLRNPPLNDDSKSRIHVAIESFRCNDDVVRDYRWTGTKSIEKQFRENADKDPTLLRQYLGTYSGLSRVFPPFRWESEPVTVDLFDPRHRPWFFNAETGSKDVVFLIDHSGSVKGQTLHLIRVQLEHILNTLNPNDFFTAIWYNSQHQKLLTGCVNDEFMFQATTRNKRTFLEYLNNVEAQDQAVLPPALNASLSLFLSSDYANARRINQTSGGHKIVMLFSDGVEFWPNQVIQQFKELNPATTIRLYSFAMGHETGEIPAIRWAACELDGGYFKAKIISDARKVSRAYLPKLAESVAKSIERRKPTDRPTSFSFPYADTQAEGVVISLSAPVINRMPKPIETNFTIQPNRPFAAIAGVDISLATIRNMLPNNEQIHAFIIDNNGIVFYHPEMKLPVREVNMVRRTACHDVRVKHRNGKRVQFGPADELIRARMGLIDTVQNLDLVEIEAEVTPKFTAFRDAAVRGDCAKEIVDGHRTYRCQRISGTPLTIGFVINRKSRALEMDGRVEHWKYEENGMIGEYLNSAALCHEFLSAVDEKDRFESLVDLADKKADCLSKSAATMLPSFIQAANEWKSSWPIFDENSTCELNSPPSQFNQFHQLTFLEYLPGVFSKFDSIRPFFNTQSQLSEIQSTAKATELEMHVDASRNHFLTLYRGLIDINTGRLISRIGVQWTAEYANWLWSSIEKATREKICGSSTIDCYLLSADLFVIASSDKSPPSHLSQKEPMLFEKLLNMSVIKRRFATIDYQATCSLPTRYAQVPANPISHSPRSMSIFEMLKKLLTTSFSWFTLDIFSFSFTLTESKVFYNTDGDCQFKLSATVERCVLAYDSYRIAVTKSTTNKLPVKSDCHRTVTIIPGTDRLLSLMILEGGCKKTKTKTVQTQFTPKKQINFKPTRVADCTLIKRRPRLQLPLLYSVDELKSKETECSNGNVKIVGNIISIFTAALVLLVY